MACDDRTSRRAQRWPRRAKSVQRVRVRTWRGRNRAILRTLGGSVERRRRPRFGAWFSRPACDPSARSRPRPCLLSSLSLPVPRPGIGGRAECGNPRRRDRVAHHERSPQRDHLHPRRSRSSAPPSRRSRWSWRPRPGARARPRDACIIASHTNRYRAPHREVPSGALPGAAGSPDETGRPAARQPNTPRALRSPPKGGLVRDGPGPAPVRAMRLPSTGRRARELPPCARSGRAP